MPENNGDDNDNNNDNGDDNDNDDGNNNAHVVTMSLDQEGVSLLALLLSLPLLQKVARCKKISHYLYICGRRGNIMVEGDSRMI